MSGHAASSQGLAASKERERTRGRSLGLRGHSRSGSEVVAFDRETVESLLASRSFFWLDLGHLTADDFDILREVFKFHPLALEDSVQFNQRAKIDGEGCQNSDLSSSSIRR